MNQAHLLRRRRIAGGITLLGALLGFGVLAQRADAYIYWTNGNAGTIGRSDNDGGHVNESFINVGSGSLPEGVAVDSSYIYWTNGLAAGKIGRAKLDGTGANGSFITGLSHPNGVAVDGSHIYWSNAGSNPSTSTIGEASLDGTTVNTNFISSTYADDPVGIAVDSSHIYWANQQTGTLGEALLNGSNPSSLVTGLENPYGVGIDSGHVYWANGSTGTIGRATLDGLAPNESFISGFSGTAGVVSDGTDLYYSPSGEIVRSNLDGTGATVLVTGADSLIAGIAVNSISPPADPTLAINPASPANDTQPLVTGSAAAGSKVALYDTADCSGTPVATNVTPSQLASGVHVTVPANATTEFSAIATNTIGPSTCSSPLAYVDDSIPPTISIASPGAGPYTQGAAVDASYSCVDSPGGSGVVSCTGTVPKGAPVATGSTGPHSFTVTARDAAGNTSTQTVYYTVVAPPPVIAPPHLTAPPRISLRGAPRCVRRAFVAHVRITDAAPPLSVSLLRDGRRLRKTTSATFSQRIRIAQLRRNSRHRLTVTVGDSVGGHATRTIHFRICGP